MRSKGTLLLLGHTESGDAGFDAQLLTSGKRGSQCFKFSVFGVTRTFFTARRTYWSSPRRGTIRQGPCLKRGITGIPAVVSDFEGTREYIINGCNGRRFPPGDASALAETLDSLCADSAAREIMGRNT
jgi:hypothetical protein